MALVWCTSHSLVATSYAQALSQPIDEAYDVMPLSAPHPMPPQLANWQDPGNVGHYFSEINPPWFGHLVWSHSPVRVYIEPYADPHHSSSQGQGWVEAVKRAVEEWEDYFPLVIISSPNEADIKVWAKSPGLGQPGLSRDDLLSGNYRIRSAETRYEIFIYSPPDMAPVLAHRFDILLSPSQTTQYVQASARHELGHALGIWGHSTSDTDAMYFSQVRNSPPISARDVNTLKHVYEQPTRLGWPLRNEHNRHSPGL
jgi:predicted Zn-dependent protease